jgi:Rhodopirellula transposase DDE domain
VINSDNGTENSTARTQWIRRLVEFSAKHQVTVKLACYPPYHSKYNPVERVFGVLENYWNGDPLTTVEKALGMAEGMTYKGVHPTATLISGSYPRGVRLSKTEMQPYEACIQRLSGLRKWFVTIPADSAAVLVSSLVQPE